jgi:hypothetical protein
MTETLKLETDEQKRQYLIDILTTHGITNPITFKIIELSSGGTLDTFIKAFAEIAEFQINK